MASIWMKVAKTSSISSRSLLGASRSGLVLTRRRVPLSSRWASTSISRKFEEEAELAVNEFDTPLPGKDKKDKQAAILSDQPEFTTLKGRISYDTLKAITDRPMKLTHMSAVQTAILPMLPALVEPYNPEAPIDPEAPKTPRDLLVKARTGTGKTLAFLVPAIEARLKAINAYTKQAVKDSGKVSDKHLEGRARRIFTRETCGTLIISPTRELATQIANEALRLTTHHDEFGVRLFVGGNSKTSQMREWMRGTRDIVVGTPGRLRDLIENEPDVLKGLSQAKMLVLDEADTLLEMGFREDIEAITRHLPSSPVRQTFLFSATVSRAIQQVARATLDKNHAFINCVSENASPVHAHVPQYHTVLPSAAEQIPHIIRLLAQDQLINPGSSKTIIFLPTTKMTQLFATFIRELAGTCLPAGKGSRIYEIHSKRTQASRTTTSDTFRKDRSGASVLISSDVSARGVDYPGVTRVIQVGIPSNADQYVHRVGRTGRGTEGQGRADLVLLPWEVGFVTWQLTEIPLKPLTVNELTAQVKELSEKFDQDPASFPQAHFRSPVADRIEGIDKEIAQLHANLDEDAVRETMGALMGYYAGKTQELRVQKNVVIQGCKDWTVEACGLAQPPYVSEAFLQRLGFHEGSRGVVGSRPRYGNQGGGYGKKSFGIGAPLRENREGARWGDPGFRKADWEKQQREGVRPSRVDSPPQHRWEGRGQQRLKDTRYRRERSDDSY